MSTLPNRDGFENLWSKVIAPEIERYMKIGTITLRDNAKEDIWNKYTQLNKQCKDNFMSETVERIDRHKIAACYILAIIKSQPLILTPNPDENLPEDTVVTINEHLAITVGLSILCAYMRHSNSKIHPKGLILPKATHGEYRKVFALELYYTKKYDMYNILSLSNTLFLLEMYNFAIGRVKIGKAKKNA